MAGYFAESKFTSQEDHELRLESYLASNLGHVFVMAIFYTMQLYHPVSILIKEIQTRWSTILRSYYIWEKEKLGHQFIS